MRVLLCLLVLACFVVGCAVEMREVGPASRSEDLGRVNLVLGNNHGRAVLQNGDTLRGSRFCIFYDSTVWRENTTHARRAFPNGDIRNLAVIAQTASAWRGMATGALAGSLSGALLGTVVGAVIATGYNHVHYESRPPDSTGHVAYDRVQDDTPPIWLIPLGAAVGASAGGLTGAVIGFIVPQLGHPFMVNFRFPIDKPYR